MDSIDNRNLNLDRQKETHPSSTDINFTFQPKPFYVLYKFNINII